MFIISNQDRDYIIKFLEVMIAHSPNRTLTEKNTVRLAGLMKKKLEAKQPFSLSDLPKDLRNFLPKK